MWAKASGSAGGYTQNQLGKARALEGTLTCTVPLAAAYGSGTLNGYYTAAGQPYVRVYAVEGTGFSCDSGWVAGSAASCSYGGKSAANASVTVNGGLAGSASSTLNDGTPVSGSCSRAWTTNYSILYGAEN